MRIETHCLTGNVNISLFWEEKWYIVMRVLQLYGFLFFTYYEYWPTLSRTQMHWFFMAQTLSFNMLNQEQYYDQVQNPTAIRNNQFYFMIALVALLAVCLFFTYAFKLRFRLENVYMSICWYKWLFWLCEWAMLPLLFNICWLGNCKFYTLR